MRPWGRVKDVGEAVQYWLVKGIINLAAPSLHVFLSWVAPMKNNAVIISLHCILRWTHRYTQAPSQRNRSHLHHRTLIPA